MAEHSPTEHVVAGEPSSHSQASKPAAEHAPSAYTFTKAEVEHFRAEDFAAGKAVVLLMVGIFSTGVVLYSIVAGTVMM